MPAFAPALPAQTPPFLEVRPPPVIARALASVLIAAFATALGLAATVPLPDTVEGRFTLAPANGAARTEAPLDGVVQQVLVREGQAVVAGQTLVLLRAEAASGAALDRDAAALSQADAEGRLAAAQASAALQAETDALVAQRLDARVTEQELVLALAEQRAGLVQTRVADAEGLRDAHAIAGAELDAAQLASAEAALALANARAGLAEARAARQQHRQEAAERVAEGQEAIRQATAALRQATLRASNTAAAPLADADGLVRVTAPCDGQLVALQVHRAGDQVRLGDPLLELHCAGEPLVAALVLPDVGVGRVRPGLPVRLAFDAFPRQRYGVGQGHLDWLGAATTTEAGPQFQASVTLDRDTFAAAGEDLPLLPGMAGNAEIVLGTRTALSYVWGRS